MILFKRYAFSKCCIIKIKLVYYIEILFQLPAVPPKWLGSADCNTISISTYPSVHKQLIRAVLEGHGRYVHTFLNMVFFLFKKLYIFVAGLLRPGIPPPLQTKFFFSGRNTKAFRPTLTLAYC